MKKIVFTLFVFLSVSVFALTSKTEVPYNLYNFQADDEKRTIVNKLAKVISSPLNTIFFDDAKKINSFYIEKYNIKAIEIFDSELKDIFLTSYADKNTIVHIIDKLPEDKHKNTLAYSSDIYNYSKKIGNLVVYFNNTKEDEKKYIIAKKILKVCVLKDYLPYSKIDNENNFTGISSDILKNILKNTKIQLKPIFVETQNEAFKNIKDEKCDIFPLAIKNKEQNLYIDFTKPYDMEPLVITTTNDKNFINNIGNLKKKKIAIIKNNTILDLIKSKYPNIQIIKVKNIKSGLEKVKNKEVFGYIDILSTINYGLKKYDFDNLKISGKTDIDLNITIALKNNQPILNNILNSGLENIDEKTFQNIYTKWINTKTDQIFYKKYLKEIVFGVIIFFIFIYIFLSKKILNKKMVAYEKDNNKTDTFFDKTLSGIIIFKDNVCIDINDFGIKMLGYNSKYEAIDKSSLNFIKEKNFKNITKSNEVKMLKKDSTEFFALVKSSTFKNNKNLFTMVSFVDLTQLKEKEKLIEKEKDKTKSAVKIKSEFLANISHEIRTPMNGILGMSHLISKTSLNRKQKNYIKKIDNSAKSLLNIIDDILDFSKMEVNNFSIEKIDFDIFKLVENVIESVKFKADEKNLELFVDYDTNITRYFYGDSLRIGQILNNLLSNAIKFTQHGEITLKIEKLFDDKFRFSVIDTGIGLTKDEKQKLFKAFTQIDGTSTRKYGGIGLGLSITKKLVKMMNGKIWVNSEKGRGSEFVFEIELKEKKNTSNNFNLFENKKVLIIDKNKKWHKILENIFMMFKIEVEHAYNSKESIKQLYECRTVYDFILVDYEMFAEDGTRIIKTINDMCVSCIKNESCNISLAPQIIMVDSFEKELMAKESRDINNIDKFLQKPINPIDLNDILSEMFLDKTPSNKNISHNNILNLKGSKILLVDDNYINQEIIIGLLENSGIIIDIANNGEEALNKFRNNDYELIFMDIQMPVMDGYEATKHIRSIDKDIPIIALTANIMSEDIQKSKSVGMNEHLNKPINIEKIYEILLKYLSSKIKLKEKYSDDDEDTFNFNHIDAFIGLSHMAGNKKLYINILNDFRNKYHDLRLDSLDEDEFHRVLHTIKGLSATIGATKLNEIVRKIDDIDKQEYIDEFYRELKMILDELKYILPLDMEITDKEFDKQKMDEILSKLREYALRRRIRGCKELLENIKIDEFSKDKDFFVRIRDMVNNRRYDEVVEAIDARQNNTDS